MGQHGRTPDLTAGEADQDGSDGGGTRTVQEDVARAEIEVSLASQVNDREGLGQVNAQHGRLQRVETSAGGQGLGQGLSLQLLHGVVETTSAVVAEVDDIDDGPTRQGSGELGLSFHPPAGEAVVAQLGLQGLEQDRALEEPVVSPADLAHPPNPYGSGDLITLFQLGGTRRIAPASPGGIDG